MVAKVNRIAKMLVASSNDILKVIDEAKSVLGNTTLIKKIEEAEKTIKKGGHSRFEWVDSVLVRSIVQGEWAVFENANLCNPSILDRLNPLLEEGNHSLCINEQGLTEGDKLRDIKAHEDFRSIFVINSHTLIDMGKDVSRALKNRCL